MPWYSGKEEPKHDDVMAQRRPSNVDAMNQQHRKSVSNKGLTGASALTIKQSIIPVSEVTLLFFLWGFAYGLLDVLNAKFQTSLNITAAKAGGLQASYFGAYFIGFVHIQFPFFPSPFLPEKSLSLSVLHI
jgi:MFS transporter, FHS family, L-fucose permease